MSEEPIGAVAPMELGICCTMDGRFDCAATAIRRPDDPDHLLVCEPRLPHLLPPQGAILSHNRWSEIPGTGQAALDYAKRQGPALYEPAAGFLARKVR